MTSQQVSSKPQCPILHWAKEYGETKQKLSSPDRKAANIMIRSFSLDAPIFEVSEKQSAIGRFFTKVGHFIVNLFKGTHDYDLQFQIERFKDESQKQISETDISTFLQQNPKLSPAQLLQNLHDLNNYVGTIANKVKMLDPATKQAVEIDALYKSTAEQLLIQQTIKQIDAEISKNPISFTSDGKITVGSVELQKVKKQILKGLGITDQALADTVLANKCTISKEKLLKASEEKILGSFGTNETPTDTAAKLWKSIDENFVTSDELKTEFFKLIEVSAQKFIKQEIKSTEFKNLSISFKIPMKGEKKDPTLEIVFESKGEKKSLSNFIKDLSRKVTGPKAEGDKSIEAMICNAIQAKTKVQLNAICKNFKNEIHAFYYTQSVPHITIDNDQIPPIFSDYVPEKESGLLFEAHYEEVPYPTGIEKDCTFIGKTFDQKVENAADKIKNFRSDHLSCVRAISNFLLTQGAIFLNSEDQQEIVDNTNKIYTLRNDQYFTANKGITDAARCIDALEGIHNYAKEVALGVYNHTGDIAPDRAGPLIVVLNEQKKACEEILKNSENELVRDRATKTKELCEQIVAEINKRTIAKDKPTEGKVSIHYHGPVSVKNLGAGNVNLGVVYGDIINSGYVINAEKAQQSFLDTTSASSIIQTMLGQTVQGAVTGFIFGGIPTMVTNGVFAATRALVQPLTEYAVKKAGASGETAQWIGFMTATAMSSYTSAYVTTYLSGKKIEDIPTTNQTTSDRPQTSPSSWEHVSSFVSKMNVFGQMKKNLGEGLSYWQGFGAITQIGSPIISATTQDTSKIKDYVFNKTN